MASPRRAGDQGRSQEGTDRVGQGVGDVVRGVAGAEWYARQVSSRETPWLGMEETSVAKRRATKMG